MKTSSKPPVRPDAVPRSWVNWESSSAIDPKTPQMSATFRPKSKASPRPKSALAVLPPAKASSAMSRPIPSRAVHTAASFSSTTRTRPRGSESRASREPRSSSPRSRRLHAISGQMAMIKSVRPYFQVT